MRVTSSVFVNSIVKKNGRVVVEASNGSEEGPPFVRFEILPPHPDQVFIGKRYNLVIHDEEA